MVPVSLRALINDRVPGGSNMSSHAFLRGSAYLDSKSGR